MHKRGAYNAIDDRRTTRGACVRTSASENVLFTILPRQTLGVARNPASLHSTSRDGVLFESCLKTLICSRSHYDPGGFVFRLTDWNGTRNSGTRNSKRRKRIRSGKYSNFVMTNRTKQSRPRSRTQ